MPKNSLGKTTNTTNSSSSAAKTASDALVSPQQQIAPRVAKKFTKSHKKGNFRSARKIRMSWRRHISYLSTLAPPESGGPLLSEPVIRTSLPFSNQNQRNIRRALVALMKKLSTGSLTRWFTISSNGIRLLWRVFILGKAYGSTYRLYKIDNKKTDKNSKSNDKLQKSDDLASKISERTSRAKIMGDNPFSITGMLERQAEISSGEESESISESDSESSNLNLNLNSVSGSSTA